MKSWEIRRNLGGLIDEFKGREGSMVRVCEAGSEYCIESGLVTPPGLGSHTPEGSVGAGRSP